MLQVIKNRLKDQRGLTLIELLAVIVILGIVAAIAIPSIMGVMDKSKEDAVKSDAIQVLNAAKLYVASEGDNGGTIAWDKLQEYVDINLNPGTTTSSNTADTINVQANVNGSDITLTGYIYKDGKLLKLTDADLGDIEGVDFNNTASAEA